VTGTHNGPPTCVHGRSMKRPCPNCPTVQIPLDDPAETRYNEHMTMTQPTVRLHFSVVNQPSGRPDKESEQTIPIGPHDPGPVIKMFWYNRSPAGSQISQVQGDYVRVWTLMAIPEGGWPA